MLSTPRIALAALILATPLGVADAATQGTAQPGFGMAQSEVSEDHSSGMMTQQPADDDEDEDGTAAAPGWGWRGGMMGRGMPGPGMMGEHGGMCSGERPMMQMMQGMMQMMQGMMRMQMMAHPRLGPGHGMMPGRFVEAHLAALKEELDITAAQEAPWNAFAAAVRARVQAMQQMRGEMMHEGRPESWPDRLARHERFLTARLDALKAMEGPTKALWDALSDAQRHRAEAVMPGMMGRMGMMGVR